MGKKLTNAELTAKLRNAEKLIAAQKEQIDDNESTQTPSTDLEQSEEVSQTVPLTNTQSNLPEKETMGNTPEQAADSGAQLVTTITNLNAMIANLNSNLTSMSAVAKQEASQLDKRFAQQSLQLVQLNATLEAAMAEAPDQAAATGELFKRQTTKLEEIQSTVENQLVSKVTLLEDAMAEAKKKGEEADADRILIQEERNEMTKYFSRHNLKVAAVVVGAIFIVAGIAYIIRRVMASGDVEAEELGNVENATPDLHVANY